MTRFLLILVIFLVGGMSYLAIRYAKDAYKVLPMSDLAEEQLESQLTAETSGYQTWEEFVHPDGDFKALMPSMPQHLANQSKDKKTNLTRHDDVYLSEKKNGNIFMIHLITYKDKKNAESADEDLLNDFMQDMLTSNPQNKLVASQPTVYRGLKALDFVIENDEFDYDFRAFIDQGSLIVLTSASKKALHNMKDFEFFINSFELKPKTKN